MADDRVSVAFTCQRCLQPLHLDESLNCFGEHLLAELTLPIHSNPDVDLESQATSYDHYIHPCRLSDSGNGVNGFTLITDGAEVETLSNQLKVHAALFDKLSGASEIDHPLCDECADALTDLLEQDLKETQDDYDDYVQYLKKVENEPIESNLSELEKELEDLKAEEQRLISELSALKDEELATLEAIKREGEESERLAVDEYTYWREYTYHRRQYLETDDETRHVENQLAYTKTQLDKLKKTNVFNATFHIWHKGHFGTINNFRMGRLPSSPVDWSEINAAWGQAVLLLSVLAKKINLEFKQYKLVPYGNHSYIEDFKEQKELPLYGSGGFRFFWDTKFDSGMVAFLECMQQFRDKIEEADKDFRLPYRMSKGKIEHVSSEPAYSIKGITLTHDSFRIQFNSEEQWTKALKFMLTNLKWYLAWVSAQFGNDEEPSVHQLQ